MLSRDGRKISPAFVAAALGVVLAAWASTGVYVVEADQVDVVTRFGAFVGQAAPGLHYHLPAPVEAVHSAPTGVNRLSIGGAVDDAAGQMLTRDGDLADMAFTVQWRIVDPVHYLFQLAAPDTTLKLAAQGAMREAVGRISLADLLSAGRGGAPARAASLMQQALDRQNAGVSIAGVQVSDVRPPEGAQAGFHDVAGASAEAQAGVRDANTYRDRVVAEAKGEVAKSVQASQSYRDQEIAEAKGEADRFALVDAEYRKAPDVTRERLYSETMERVLHNTRKVIVQTPPGSSTQIILPPELFRPKSSDTPAPASPSPTGPSASISGDAQNPSTTPASAATASSVGLSS